MSSTNPAVCSLRSLLEWYSLAPHAKVAPEAEDENVSDAVRLDTAVQELRASIESLITGLSKSDQICQQVSAFILRP